MLKVAEKPLSLRGETRKAVSGQSPVVAGLKEFNDKVKTGSRGWRASSNCNFPYRAKKTQVLFTIQFTIYFDDQDKLYNLWGLVQNKNAKDFAQKQLTRVPNQGSAFRAALTSQVRSWA